MKYQEVLSLCLIQLKGELGDKWEEFLTKNPELIEAKMTNLDEFLDWSQKAQAAFKEVKK